MGKISNWLKTPRATIKGKSFFLPLPTKFPRVRLPSFKLGTPTFGGLRMANSRIKYVIAGVTMVSLSAVSVGLYFAVEDVVSATYEYPEAGAIYRDLHTGGTLGDPIPPDPETGEESQTLHLFLASGARLSTLSFVNMDLGKSGLTDCVTIMRDGANTTGYLFVDDMYVTGVSAPSFDMANSEVSSLTTAGKVDGYTWGASMSSTISDQIITSTRGSGSFSASDVKVDRIIIQMVGDATVGTLTFQNVKCSVGGWNIDYVKVGDFIQDSTSRFGDGDGIDTADYVLQQSVTYRTASNSMVDEPITVR
jgi:hypothetical protein